MVPGVVLAALSCGGIRFAPIPNGEATGAKFGCCKSRISIHRCQTYDGRQLTLSKTGALFSLCASLVPTRLSCKVVGEPGKGSDFERRCAHSPICKVRRLSTHPPIVAPPQIYWESPSPASVLCILMTTPMKVIN